jgi:hypothetical protein
VRAEDRGTTVPNAGNCLIESRHIPITSYDRGVVGREACLYDEVYSCNLTQLRN